MQSAVGVGLWFKYKGEWMNIKIILAALIAACVIMTWVNIE